MRDGSMRDDIKETVRAKRPKAGVAAVTRFVTNQNTIWRAATALCVGASVYWGVIASDRYVSEADVLIEHTQLTAEKTVDLGSLLGGGSGGGNRAEQLLLRSYLLSSDMMKKLDAKLHLRAHFSDQRRDPLSRLSTSASLEAFHRYYLSRISVEFDDYSGVLVIKVQAFDPKTAQAITQMLVAEGENYMNEIGHNLAESQVTFLEKQVAQMATRYQQARLAVLNFQNKHDTVSPESTAETDVGSINKLRSTRVELETRRAALLAYLTPEAPGVVDLNVQIAAIDKQIAEQQSRLTGGKGTALNHTVEEYQRLQMAAGFAEDVYKTALAGLEKGRVEVTRTLKKVSVLQAPTLAEEPLQPRRLYNIVTFVLVTMLVAGILNLLAAIIRDHKD
jgi:capsular polysaccharide transport system permease protein